MADKGIPADEMGEKLTRLASNILDELLEEGNDTPLGQRIDALKVIGPLHLGLRRLDKRVPSDADLPGFNDVKRRLGVVGGRDAGENDTSDG